MTSRNKREGRYGGFHKKHMRVPLLMRRLAGLSIHMPQVAIARIFSQRKKANDKPK